MAGGPLKEEQGDPCLCRVANMMNKDLVFHVKEYCMKFVIKSRTSKYLLNVHEIRLTKSIKCQYNSTEPAATDTLQVIKLRNTCTVLPPAFVRFLAFLPRPLSECKLSRVERFAPGHGR